MLTSPTNFNFNATNRGCLLVANINFQFRVGGTAMLLRRILRLSRWSRLYPDFRGPNRTHLLFLNRLQLSTDGYGLSSVRSSDQSTQPSDSALTALGTFHTLLLPIYIYVNDVSDPKFFHSKLKKKIIRKMSRITVTL